MPMQKPGGVSFVGPPLRVPPPIGQQGPAQHPIYGPVNPMIQRFASGGVARSGVSLPVSGGPDEGPSLFPTPIPGNNFPTPTPAPVPTVDQLGSGFGDPPFTGEGDPRFQGGTTSTSAPPPGWDPTMPVPPDVPAVDPITGRAIPIPTVNPGGVRVGGVDPNARAAANHSFWLGQNPSATMNPMGGTAGTANGAFTTGAGILGGDLVPNQASHGNQSYNVGTDTGQVGKTMMSSVPEGTAGTEAKWQAQQDALMAQRAAAGYASASAQQQPITGYNWQPNKFATSWNVGRTSSYDPLGPGSGGRGSVRGQWVPTTGANPQYAGTTAPAHLYNRHIGQPAPQQPIPQQPIVGAGGLRPPGGPRFLGPPIRLAHGGIVPGRHPQFGDTVPAMLTPGEIVLNANEQRAMRIAPGKRPLLPPSITNQLYKNRMANPVQHFAQGGAVQPNPANRGMLHRNLGVPMGNKIPLALLMKAKHSPSMAVRKRANFAVNFAH